MRADPIKSAINRAYEFCEEQQRSLDEGRITEEQWFTIHKSHFTRAYLSGGNPRSQSGYDGDEQRYHYTQSMILSAVNRGGTFLDVGCVNGYLIEQLSLWFRERKGVLEFYGVVEKSHQEIKVPVRRLHWFEARNQSALP